MTAAQQPGVVADAAQDPSEATAAAQERGKATGAAQAPGEAAARAAEEPGKAAAATRKPGAAAAQEPGEAVAAAHERDEAATAKEPTEAAAMHGSEADGAARERDEAPACARQSGETAVAAAQEPDETAGAAGGAGGAGGDGGTAAGARFAEAVVLVLLVALPAVLNPAGAAAFEPLKSSLVRVAALIALIGWLAARGPGGVVRLPIARAGLVVLGVMAISTAASVEPALSLLGSFDRGMGWLTLAAGVALMLVGADLWTDPRRRERAISALLISAVVPCAYLIVQRLGRDPIPWSSLGAPGSTLGSPTFLAGYLVMLAPLALYRVVGGAQTLLAADRTIGAAGYAAYAGWLALLLVIGGTVAQSTIRGALLGLVAGTLAFTLLLGRPGKAALAGALAFLVLALGLAVTATGGTGVQSISRFLRVASGGDSSTERLVVWRDALVLPLSDPLRAVFGFGPESQVAVLERAEATVRLTQNQQWDRVHNLFLDTWLSGGAVGLIALLALVGGTVWSLARTKRALLAAAVLGALIGHLVEVSFAFHTVVTGTLFWVLIGLAASLTAGPGQQRQPRHFLRLATPSKLLAAVACLGLVPLLAAPAVGDAIYGAGRSELQAGDARGAAMLDETASAWLPWVEEPIRAAGLAWQQVATRQNDSAARARAESDLLEAARRAPSEPTPQVRLLRLYLLREQLTEAEAACTQALELGPYRAVVWDACADVSARRGLTGEAQERRARAEALRQPLP